jgi:hypothetical protein
MMSSLRAPDSGPLTFRSEIPSESLAAALEISVSTKKKRYAEMSRAPLTAF